MNSSECCCQSSLKKLSRYIVLYEINVCNKIYQEIYVHIYICVQIWCFRRCILKEKHIPVCVYKPDSGVVTANLLIIKNPEKVQY